MPVDGLFPKKNAILLVFGHRSLIKIKNITQTAFHKKLTVALLKMYVD